MNAFKSSVIEIVHEPIDTAGLLDQANRPECGAVLLFLGTTRQWTGNEQTRYLEYEAYEAMARVEMERLASEALRRWPIAFVAMVHRLGRVDVGQASIAIVVSAPHRRSAFEAGEWLIDVLKQAVPIWKRDHDATGNAEWLHPHNVGEPRSAPRVS